MKAYYDSTKENAMHLRAVVGANGNVVARNYNPQFGKKGSLQSGDVGITVSVHEDVSVLTPAQAASAQAMAAEMTDRLKERVGMDTELGFAPGTVVCVTDDPVGLYNLSSSNGRFAVIEGQVEGGLYVRAFTLDYEATYRAYVSLAREGVAEIPGYRGLEGLLVRILQIGSREWTETILASKYANALIQNKEVCLEALRSKEANEEIQRDLLRRLDQASLRELVVAPEHTVPDYARSEVKELALEFIEDQDVLESLARRFLRENQRMFEAVLRHLDQERLIKLFEDPGLKGGRLRVIQRIHDQEWLTAYVLGSRDVESTELRAEAIVNIEDRTVLSALCEEEGKVK